MTYNPATDFLGLWRNTAGVVSKAEMPGLDHLIAALARAGVISVSVSATQPVANQSTTAWLQAAVPSYSAEGAFFLWDKVTTTYLAATPKLFLQFLEASANDNGATWWTAVGAPLNTVGNDGDFVIRTDEPGGVYGPKVAGAYPVTPLPGTTNIIDSAELDNTFGTSRGQLIYRGASLWQALAINVANTFLVSNGSDPQWGTFTNLLDAVVSATQGSILYRGAATWGGLPPGVATQVLTTSGPGADPAWANRTAEFSSGTVMLFQQTAAPTGWTKQTGITDYGLRVTSGAVGASAATPFSVVFGQTTVGAHALSVAEMPAHGHPVGGAGPTPIYGTSGGGIGGGGSFGVGGTFTIDNTGGGGTHSHAVNLTLSYVDVIIASKN